MNQLASLGIRTGALAFITVLCAGCPNPNTYGTPRTTPKGKVQHTVAAEGFGLDYETPGTTDPTTGQKTAGTKGSLTVPNFPTYQLRVGVTDTVDIGARIANMSSLGADVKWNFIRGETFDMATVPGLQVFRLSTSSGSSDGSFTQFYANLPLVFGINLADALSIVPTAGITYSLSSAEALSDQDDAARTTDGLFVRAGLGFNFRISQKFAMHPEITLLKNVTDTDKNGDVLLYVFGLGFNFGSLPVYGAAEAGE